MSTPRRAIRQRFSPRSSAGFTAAVSVLAVILAACTSTVSGEPQGAPAPPESSEAVPSSPAPTAPADDDEVAAIPPEQGPVQDVWIFERIRALGTGGALIDVTDDLVDSLTGDSEAVELTEGVTFHPEATLGAAIVDGDGAVRDDLDVVGGLVKSDEGHAIQFIATPTGSRSVGPDDLIVFDMGSLGYAPGTPLVVDYAFAQGLPSEGDPAGLDGPALFAHRFAAGNLSYFATDTAEDVDPGLLTVIGTVPGLTGGALRGSTPAWHLQPRPGDSGSGGGIPAKAQGPIGALGKLGCIGSPIKCIRKYFTKQRKATKRAMDDLFKRNMSPDPTPSKPPSKKCVGSCGDTRTDPHIVTFDGYGYDLQLVGEFVLADSAAASVHMRTGPWKDSTTVSVPVAAAVRIGDHRVTVQAGREPLVLIDGQPAGDLGSGITVGEMEVTDYGRHIHITGTQGFAVVIGHVPHMRDAYSVTVDTGTAVTSWRGLLGDANGQPRDDLVARDGTAASAEPSVDEIYQIGDSWRIDAAESLFDYAVGESTETFTDLDFPSEVVTYDDLDEAQRAAGEELCRAAGIEQLRVLRWCIFDVAMTGEIGFVQAHQDLTMTYDRPREGWMTTLPDLRNLLYPPQVDQDGHVLVAESDNPGALGFTYVLHALDIDTGAVEWVTPIGDPECLAVTAEGRIVAPVPDGDGDALAIGIIDPAGGSVTSSVAAPFDACDVAAVSGESVVLRRGKLLVGFDAATSKILFDAEVEGVVSGPVASDDGVVHLVTRVDDGPYRALQVDPATGVNGRTKLPVHQLTGEISATATGFVAAFTDEDDRTGGLLRFAPDKGPQVTELPQRAHGLGYGLFGSAPLAVSDGLVAGYIAEDTIAVINIASGKPVTQFTHRSFNNNQKRLAMADGVVVVSPFGTDTSVEAYSASDGSLVWSRPDEGPESIGVSGLSRIGPVTPSGQFLGSTSGSGGIIIVLYGPGR